MEIHSVEQRNERLRYIQNELNILAKLKGNNNKSDEIIKKKMIVDPKYVSDEKPETIVTVEDSEVAVSPYISPSNQQLLDLAIKEKERHRLAMLADDFRDRALIKMMDGVLEIRWEDEIKKIPPMPDCLVSI